MDDKYVGLEGCEDLWELLRSVHQAQDLLKGWLRYFNEEAQFSGETAANCALALGAIESVCVHVKFIYSDMFKSLQ